LALLEGPHAELHYQSNPALTAQRVDPASQDEKIDASKSLEGDFAPPKRSVSLDRATRALTGDIKLLGEDHQADRDTGRLM